MALVGKFFLMFQQGFGFEQLPSGGSGGDQYLAENGDTFTTEDNNALVVE